MDPGEECDDSNVHDGDPCLPGCVLARCGDGLVRDNPDDAAAFELCDRAGLDCRSDESCPNGILDIHGNGTTNDPERCDDGNDNHQDACRNDCQSS